MRRMVTSPVPQAMITWSISSPTGARRIRETRKIPTALIFVLERMASRWREEMSFPQNAVTRMLTQMCIRDRVVKSGFKFLGYRAGKCYRLLPKWLILKLTMNREYWKKACDRA